MSKGKLFLDIDGVIRAHYGGCWQIRPYVGTLLEWAEKHFDIYWLSYNSARKEIADIVWSLYCSTVPSYENNGLGKLDCIDQHGGIDSDWIMIEDTPPTIPALKLLREKNISHRWLVIPDTGANVLLDVRFILENWVENKKMIIPLEWAENTYNREKRNFNFNVDYEGFQGEGMER